MKIQTIPHSMKAEHNAISYGVLSLMILAILFLMFLLTASPSASAQTSGFPHGPQLVVTAIEFSDDDPAEDSDVTISVTLTNEGTTDLGNITLRLLINGEIEGETPGLTLAGGESVTRDYTWTAESGGNNVTSYALVDGITVSSSAMSDTLSVNLGDISTILYALFMLVIAVVVMAVVPSVANTFRK